MSIYLSLTVTTKMTCIKMGSDESRFNVSLIVRDKITRPCPQTTTFEEKGESKRYQTEVLPLTIFPPISQSGAKNPILVVIFCGESLLIIGSSQTVC